MQQCITDTLKFQGKQYTIDIVLNSKVSIIRGSSGVGKSLIGKLLRLQDNNIIYFDYSDVNHLMNIVNTDSGIAKFKCHDKIIIIDNFDEVYNSHPEIADAINVNVNHNIIVLFCRRLNIPIDVDRYSIGDLIFDDSNSTFSVNYRFKKV